MEQEQHAFIEQEKEIQIKLKDFKLPDIEYAIKINQDTTVGDLINKIKENQDIVGNGQFLYLCCENGGPNNGILSCKESMNLKLSDFKINNDSELSFDVFDINNSYTKKVLAKLLADDCVVKIVQDGNIEIVFEKSIKYNLCLNKKFYTVLPMKLCDEIKSLITLGAYLAYNSYPIINDRDDVYFKINFGDRIITDLENTDQNESLENMAIKQGSVLNIEITTWRNNEKVLTEKDWVKAIDIIEKNKVEQEKEKKNVENLEIKEIDENEHQNSHSNWKRILFFVVGIFSLIAALVIFLVNPELLALIIPLAVSGGISLLVGFLWNTIKSCFIGSESEKISIEPLTETNEYDPNKITNQNDPNNNLSPEKDTSSKNGQEQTE